MYMMRIYQKF